MGWTGGPYIGWAVLIGMPCLAFIWGVFFVRWFDE